jgi:hypothetical protein
MLGWKGVSEKKARAYLPIPYLQKDLLKWSLAV